MSYCKGHSQTACSHCGSLNDSDNCIWPWIALHTQRTEMAVPRSVFGYDFYNCARPWIVSHSQHSGMVYLLHALSSDRPESSWSRTFRYIGRISPWKISDSRRRQSSPHKMGFREFLLVCWSTAAHRHETPDAPRTPPCWRLALEVHSTVSGMILGMGSAIKRRRYYYLCVWGTWPLT